MARIVVSFKSNALDKELYEEICNASDKSAYVKDILREHKRIKEEYKKLEEKLRILELLQKNNSNDYEFDKLLKNCKSEDTSTNKEVSQNPIKQDNYNSKSESLNIVKEPNNIKNNKTPVGQRLRLNKGDYVY